MDKDSKALLIEAVNTLVEDTEAKALFKQMEWVAELARKGVSVGLTGHAAVLNPLLALWSWS
jgi:predicted HAD superfamily phosphohydrolase YqeG